MIIDKDKIVQELLDLIAKRQLLGETFPELSGDRLEAIADSIRYEWNEAYEGIGHIEEFKDVVKWNLEQNLTHW
jgi:hypothetical protein|tara:strand:- start:791 stop:1012 length:222 start_codon:yes stop_codon:yes gene_type:complete